MNFELRHTRARQLELCNRYYEIQALVEEEDRHETDEELLEIHAIADELESIERDLALWGLL